MNETINYTRLTTSDKLSDRFLTCQSYSPIDPEQAESGMVFSQVEIMNPWFPTNQIGQTVINNLIREYYRGTDRSELVNFENAIKKVNESLAQIAQNGDTDWIGKFSSVLLLFNQGEVHFAQTGQSHAYLYRSGKINHITEGLEQEDAPHPLKTYSNLTSGTLQLGDRMIIANSSFYEVIHPSELKTIITSFPPAIAAIECAKMLQSHGAHEANAIFIEYTTKDDLANIPPDQKQEVIYIDQQLQSVSTALKGAFKGFAGSFAKFSSKTAQATQTAAKNHLGPLAKKGWELSKQKSKEAFTKTADVAKHSASKIHEKVQRNEKEQPTEGLGDTEVVKKDSAKLNISKTAIRMKNKLRRFLIHSGLYSSKKSKMYLLALLIILLVLSSTIAFGFYNSGKDKKSKSFQEKINQITSLQGDAAIANAKADQKTELLKYKEIIRLSDELKDSKYSIESSKARSLSETKIKELINLEILKPDSEISTKSSGGTLISGSNLMYFVDDSLTIKSLASNSLSLTDLFKLDKVSGKIVSALENENGTISLLNDSKKLFTANVKDKTVKIESAPIKYSGQLQSFSNNLFMLDQASNQIWKVAESEGQYPELTPYLKDENIDITKSLSIAIDGSVYTISQEGQIQRISRGQKVDDYSISLPADEKINTFQKIETNEGSDFLYVSSKENSKYRVIKLKKNGTFVKQFELDSSEDSAGIVIDPKTEMTYLIKNDKIIKYKLN